MYSKKILKSIFPLEENDDVIVAHGEDTIPFSCFALYVTHLIAVVDQVKEKTIAARRSQVKTIIFPSANRRDFDELAQNIKEGLNVHFVDEYSQILDVAFGEEVSSTK